MIQSFYDDNNNFLPEEDSEPHQYEPDYNNGIEYIEPQQKDDLFNLIHADELANLPPIQWLIDEHIPERGLIVLYGPSGIGKSFVALDYALQIAQEKPVIYVASEGFHGYKKRTSAWRQTHAQDNGNLYMINEQILLLEHSHIEQLISTIKAKAIQPALIIFDTLAYAISGGDENSAKDMQKLIGACREIEARCETAIMLIHHSGKTNASYERGSSALRGGVDIIMKLIQSNGHRILKCEKSKDTKPFEDRKYQLKVITLEDEEESCVALPVTQNSQSAIKLTDSQKKVLEFLAMKENKKGCKSKLISDQCKIKQVYRVLNQLKALNYVHHNKKESLYTITEEGRKTHELDTA